MTAPAPIVLTAERMRYLRTILDDGGPVRVSDRDIGRSVEDMYYDCALDRSGCDAVFRLVCAILRGDVP